MELEAKGDRDLAPQRAERPIDHFVAGFRRNSYTFVAPRAAKPVATLASMSAARRQGGVTMPYTTDVAPCRRSTPTPIFRARPPSRYSAPACTICRAPSTRMTSRGTRPSSLPPKSRSTGPGAISSVMPHPTRMIRGTGSCFLPLRCPHRRPSGRRDRSRASAITAARKVRPACGSVFKKLGSKKPPALSSKMPWAPASLFVIGRVVQVVGSVVSDRQVGQLACPRPRGRRSGFPTRERSVPQPRAACSTNR